MEGMTQDPGGVSTAVSSQREMGSPWLVSREPIEASKEDQTELATRTQMKDASDKASRRSVGGGVPCWFVDVRQEPVY